MDNLAAEGCLFENAFVTTAICMASRASIFTGLYERKHDCNFNTGDLNPAFWKQSYPVMLRDADYYTGFIGKFGFAVTDEPREHNMRSTVWHDINNLPTGDFDAWYGFAGQGTYFPEGKDGRHLTQIMTDQAIEFLANTPQEKPFCLSISFKAPHAPFTPDPAYNTLYENDRISVPATGYKEFFDRLPKFLQESHAHISKANNGYWLRRYSTPALYQDTMKKYYRLVTGVDAAIGNIRRELQKLALDKNTIIILMGDNGEFESEHLLGGKALLREESIRVPLIIYDPRLPAEQRGKRLKELALNIDIAPTLLSLAGVNMPDIIQGRSLMPLVIGRHTEWRQDFFCENNFMLDERNNSPQYYPMCEAVRTDRWKYIRYTDQQPVYEELYDLEKDPHEITNLAYNPVFSDTLTKLRKRCEEYVIEAEK